MAVQLSSINTQIVTNNSPPITSRQLAREIRNFEVTLEDSVTHEPLITPIQLKCGHSNERTTTLALKHCATCRDKITQNANQLVTNYTLKGAADSWNALSPLLNRVTTDIEKREEEEKLKEAMAQKVAILFQNPNELANFEILDHFIHSTPLNKLQKLIITKLQEGKLTIPQLENGIDGLNMRIKRSNQQTLQTILNTIKTDNSIQELTNTFNQEKKALMEEKMRLEERVQDILNKQLHTENQLREAEERLKKSNEETTTRMHQELQKQLQEQAKVFSEEKRTLERQIEVIRNSVNTNGTSPSSMVEHQVVVQPRNARSEKVTNGTSPSSMVEHQVVIQPRNTKFEKVTSGAAIVGAVIAVAGIPVFVAFPPAGIGMIGGGLGLMGSSTGSLLVNELNK